MKKKKYYYAIVAFNPMDKVGTSCRLTVITSSDEEHYPVYEVLENAKEILRDKPYKDDSLIVDTLFEINKSDFDAILKQMKNGIGYENRVRKDEPIQKDDEPSDGTIGSNT